MFAIALVCFTSLQGDAQTIHMTGYVVDSMNGQPLTQVNIFQDKELLHTETDNRGFFSIDVREHSSISFQYTGYKNKHIIARPSNDSVLYIVLSPNDDQLTEVIIHSAKRRKYSNKNNPAVELIRKIIAHKPENTIGSYTTAQYEQYAKLSFFAEHFPKWMSKSKILKNYAFILKANDTLTIPDKRLLPLYLEEVVSQQYYKNNPKANGSIVMANKHVDYGKFIDMRGISSLFNRLFEDVNIYDNNIVVFTRQFVSPIANSGPVWYKYFIEDTVEMDNQKLIQLHFEPRNSADLLFNGEMFVTMDGRYAVKQIAFETEKDINLGVVRSFNVNQDFVLDSTGHYHLTHSDVVADFGLYKNLSGLVGRRVVDLSHFKSGMPIEDSLLQSKDDILLRKPNSQTAAFWEIHRPAPLQNGEKDIYAKMDSLNNMKSFRNATDWINTLTSGYKTFGKYQLGPVNSFVDYNPVEGFKPRLGGRTTSDFNKSIYLNGYAAYGFRDQKVKYMGRFTYSFNHESIYSYPVHSLAVSQSFDTNIPGTTDDNERGNIIFANSNSTFNRYLYNHIFRVDYLKELDNHLAFGLGLKLKSQRAGGDLAFVKTSYLGNDSIIATIPTTELSFQVRWAPKEQFYQNGARRFRIPNRYPVFTFTYTKGANDLLGGKYNYDNFNLDIKKRFFMSILGVSRVVVNAGYLKGQLPWPLLTIHAGNQGIGYIEHSFNMMNYMEFMSDHYASLSIVHHFNGLFFNRIPLFKKLKWREIVGANILYGGVRNENNPAYNNQLLQLPVFGNSKTYFLTGKPYVELNAGISNIFKIMEVNVIKRMTYLDHPDINKWSIKASFQLEL